MRASSVNALAPTATAFLAAVGLSAIAFELGSIRYGWVPTLASLVLLLILWTMVGGVQRSFAQSLAYGASCGFLLATAAMFPLVQMVPEAASSPTDLFSAKPWFPAIFLVGTLIFLGIDRVRTNTSPVVLEMGQPTTSAAMPDLLPARMSSVAEPGIQVPQPGAATPQRVVQPMAAVPEPVTPAALSSETVQVPAPVLENAPVRVAISGKPAVIYMNLVNTGIACLRPVQAEHLGKDFYKVVEGVPAGEQWEFQPGQVVRCRKKNLSNGKAMVAFEEAPRVA